MDGGARTSSIGDRNSWRMIRQSVSGLAVERDRTQNRIPLLLIALYCMQKLARIRIKFSAFFLVTFESP
jgi:hypothetical protein